MEQGGDAEISIGYDHIPVLLTETLAGLQVKPGGTYIDCTVGYGGIAAAILQQDKATAVLGIDQDEEALAIARLRLAGYGARLRLVHGRFADLPQLVQAAGLDQVDGIVFDLGVSSPQLDDPRRGFSFTSEGPLDMRMDRRQDETAADLLARLPESGLADLIFRYGEERYARRIARGIVRARQHEPITTTLQLVGVIRDAVPASYRHGRLHCATRTFQALRIAVNRELEGLDRAFADAANLLVDTGRLCIISFHSLEDRVAKHTIRALSQGSTPLLRIVTKKPIRPSDEERHRNPRARSAKLRVAERVLQRSQA